MLSSRGSMPTTQLSVKETRRVGHQAHRLQEIVGHHRIVDVELEMALAAGERDRGVVAEDLHADLRQRLALGRVDLARHDRGAGLVLRQRQLAEARARARAEQADVVGDLEQRRRDRVDGAVREHHGVVRGQRLELVGRGGERQLVMAAMRSATFSAKPFGRVEAGADRGAALRQLHQRRAASARCARCRSRPAGRSRKIPGRASGAWRPACACGRS